MPRHQATAGPGAVPVGVPSSRPRSVSMTGVTGWCVGEAAAASAGIVSTGTKALLG